MSTSQSRFFRALPIIRKVNIVKTIKFNFKFLPFRQAIHQPILLMGGGVKLCKSSGFITLNSCHTGTIRIGCQNHRLFGRDTSHKTIIRIDGHLNLGNQVSIGNGCAIAVESGATLSIGSFVDIGPLTKIYCDTSISIGENTNTSWEVQIFDTDFHYMIDNHIVRRCNSPIVIGDHVWIGNRVTINKGSMIPNWSIVASNSLVNKDFSQYGSGILAGCPAKFIPSTKRRIFSYSKESLLNDYFREHCNALEYTET